MTQKAIGPSFSDELALHGGLVGEHFTWSPDGTIEFFEDTPVSVISGVEAVYAAHDPKNPTWDSIRHSAQTELNNSDVTVIRCVESDIPVPADWVAYRKSLRAIVGAESGDATKEFPIKPPYPEGS
jgi:hypothetical protein